MVANIDTGRPVRPPGAGEPVPRQQRRRHVQPRLQLVRRRRHLRRPRPCDTNGHGTHTMGTMVGDDGAANQIGVAPGAKWIAANGCCPSDAALIASGQWMLAPTDLDGHNPDASKRPNIINNSWGTHAPDQRPVHGGRARRPGPPRASSGPGPTATAARPARPAAPRAAGSATTRPAPTTSTTTSPASPRAAPARTARSSPTSRRPASTSGPASRAAATPASTARRWPHRTWPARSRCCGRPRRRCSVTSTRTRALLDGTAIDKADDQCGGTADDNNVFGEGRLDALALLNAAPSATPATLAARSPTRPPAPRSPAPTVDARPARPSAT